MSTTRQIKQPRRKEAVIRAAAEVMKEKGVLATRLQDVAEYLGVAYTALYHYFPSRDHLAEEVLCWTIAHRMEFLETARGESALDRFLDFFERSLMEDRVVQVRIPSLLTLPEPNRKSVTKARNDLLACIVKILDEGIQDGSIRSCDPLTVANVLLVLLERFSVFDEWLFPEDVQSLPPDKVVREICETLRMGILEGEDSPPRASYKITDAKELFIFDTGLTPELARLDKILAIATRHFNRDAASASIPRMVEEMDVSKTVIYQYALDKQDLLFQCYLRGVSIVEMSHRIADEYGKDPLDASLIHRHNLYFFHDSDAGPFTFLNAVHFLKPQHQRLIKARNKGLQDTSVERLRRARDLGQIRASVNPGIAQPIFGQMLYGLPGWYSDDYPLDIEEVCWQSALVPLLGLQRRD